MAKQTINIGTNANDGTGDPLRTAFQKINDNFAELYGDDSSADTFTSPQITTPTITGTATIDNLIFNDSEISTASNANLNLNPGGTGTIELQAATNITGALDVTGAATLDTSLTLAAGATITEFATSTSLGTSDTKVPTQNAVKTYVDSQMAATAITFVGDDSTGTAVNSGEIFKIAGGTGLTSAVVGDALTLDIDSSVVTLTGGQTLTNKILTAPTIIGATTIDNLTFDDNIIGTASNADLILTPGGTGQVSIPGNLSVVGTANIFDISSTGTANLTTVIVGNGIAVTGDVSTTGNHTVSGNVTISGTVYSDRIKSPASNANLSILAQGTGVVDVQSPMTTVAQTISGNVTVPDGFITQLGNIQVYSNTITSTTNGDINIVANAGGQIILNAQRVGAGQINATTVALSGTLDTNSIRSFDSNADINIEPQGVGRVKIIGLGLDTDSVRSTSSNADLVISTQGTGAITLDSKIILSASQSDGSTTAIDLTKPVAILRGSDSFSGGDTEYTLGDGTTAGQIIYFVPGIGVVSTMKLIVGKLLYNGSIQTNYTFSPFTQGSPGGHAAYAIWNGSAWCFGRHA